MKRILTTDKSNIPFGYIQPDASYSITGNTIIANKYIISGGTSSQFLKGDGSFDENVYITTISGITAGGDLIGDYPNPYIDENKLFNKKLTNLQIISGGSININDNILDAFGKLQYQISNEISGNTYIGTEGIYINKINNNLTFETQFTSSLNDNLTTISVGGLPSTTIGNLKGQSLRKILEDILAPTQYPTLTNPYIIFTKNGNSVFETGSNQNFTFTTTFDRGLINPQYFAISPYRSGLPISFNYTGSNLNTTNTNVLSNTQTINCIIQNGNNTWTSSVTYNSGNQPYDNKGNIFQTPLVSGTTGVQTITVTGIYPFFYYKSSSTITSSSMKNAIETGLASKVITPSNGTISITFNASDEYIAVAYPSNYTTKTVWYVNALNNGSIGGQNDLFSFESILPINSPMSLWNNINFKIHVSNYATTTNGVMELRNI